MSERPPSRNRDAEAGQVAQRGVDPAVEHPGAELVDADRGIGFGADLAPQQVGTSARASDSPEAASQTQPSMSVSQERYSKAPPWAVFCRSVIRYGYMPVGPGAAGGRPADGLLQHPHLGERVQVVLGELDARAHVQQVAHRGPGVAGVGQFRAGTPVSCASASSTPESHRAPATAPMSDLLTDISRCESPGLHPAEVLLGEHPSAVQHHPPVGVGGRP